jgi:Beta galactosidase small chain.
MEIVYGDVNLGIKSDKFSLLFSYSHTGLESLKKDGTEWLYRTVHPSFWRATTDNDRGSGFSMKSAEWMGADLFIRCSDFYAVIDGKKLDANALQAPENNALINSPLRKAKEATMVYIYKTVTYIPATVTVKYIVTEDSITVEYGFEGAKGLSSPPSIGLRFLIPFILDGYEYTGLEGETYPDRKQSNEGIFSFDKVEVTPYVIPQECGMHMDSENLVLRKESASLRITKADTTFPFSLLPNTPLELESAYHTDELPDTGRTVLTLYAAVRGVGGINSWGADVEEEYRLKGEGNYHLSFRIE